MASKVLKSADRRRFAFWKRFVIAGQNGVYLRRLRVIQTPWFSIYWHHIDGPDPDPYPHDHPWAFASFVIRGGYEEVTYYGEHPRIPDHANIWNRFSFHRIPAEGIAHKIYLVKPKTTTLIFAGPRKREWGFWSEYGWEQWEQYLNRMYGTSSPTRKKEPLP